MMSKRTKYAIKTLVYLYQHKEQTPISAKVIAEAESIPYKFLENILRELRQNKILRSERGAEGGYCFLKAPETVKVVDVIRLIDGPVALLPCVSLNFYHSCAECTDEATCKIRKLFLEVRDATLPILDKSIIELSGL